MRSTVVLCRLLLGAVFLLFGLNTLLWSFGTPLFPPPPSMPERAAAFQHALTATGFMHPLRGAVESAAGLLLVTGMMVPLALVLLAPVLAHVVLYHAVLDPTAGGRVFTGVLVALAMFLLHAYASSFAGLLRLRPPSRWHPRADAAGRTVPPAA